MKNQLYSLLITAFLVQCASPTSSDIPVHLIEYDLDEYATIVNANQYGVSEGILPAEEKSESELKIVFSDVMGSIVDTSLVTKERAFLRDVYKKTSSYHTFDRYTIQYLPSSFTKASNVLVYGTDRFPVHQITRSYPVDSLIRR